MAVKIRSGTLTVTGLLRANMVFDGAEPPGHVEGDTYANSADVYFTANVSAFGCTFEGSFSREIIAETHSDGTGWVNSDGWSADMVVGGPGADDGTHEYRAIREFAPGTPEGGDGSYTFSVPVDLMYEAAPVASSAGTDHGVFHAPPATAARLFYQTTTGAEYSTTATMLGLTVTSNGVITSAVEVNLVGVLNISLNVSVGGSGNNTGYLDAFDLWARMQIGTLNVGGAYHYSDDHFDVNNTDGARAQWTGGDGRGAAYAYVSGQPPRSFALTGAVHSVGDAYPDAIDMVCARYGGDPDPTFTGGATFGRSGTQYEYDESYHVTGTSEASASQGLHTYTPVQVTLDSTWCREQGEYVTYEVGDPPTTTFFDNALIYMQGWSMPGLTLTQDAETTVDDCSSATGWAGAGVVTGGLQPTAGTMTRTFADPGFNFSGYAYLRIRGRCESGAATRTLSLGGKSWDLPLTSTTTDVDIDLLDPMTGGADSDTTDTKWPVDLDARDISSGPLWGVSTENSLSLSGFDSAHPDTIAKISLVRKDGTQVHLMGEWAPRAASDQPQFSPERDFESGQVQTTYVSRLLVADTDGRQSLEEWGYAHDHVAGNFADYWIQRPQSIAGLAGTIETVPGWHATVDAPASDSSENLHDGFLNADAPAAWLMGNGLLYVGEEGWQSGVGLTLGDEGISLSARPLFTSIDWPAGIGDVFGLAPEGAPDDGTLYLAASKVLRAQAHGVLLTDQGHGRAPGQAVQLLDADGDAVGVARSRSPEGDYRTRGEGLPGYAGGEPSQGTVTTGDYQADTAFRSARLSRVALRARPKPPCCCDTLLFDDPETFDPLPAQAGDQEILPVQEWKR